MNMDQTLDIRSLACFVAVADLLHFRRAAERLNITQPALSQRIRQLEEEVGTLLLERDRRHVALTPAGAAFLDPAKAAVANASAAKALALRAVRGETGRLRLGFTVIAFYGFLPEAVRRFRARFPDVAVELAEMNSPTIEAALASAEIDLGVLHPPLTAPGLVEHALPEQRLMLALPASHGLAERPVVPVAALEGEPFLTAPRAIGPSVYDRVIAFFRSNGISPRIIQEVTPMTTLAGLVAAGVGMGFVTEGIATVARPGIAFRPVEPDPPRLPMGLAWRAPSLSPAGSRFLDILAELTQA
jgi:DNA-binding transcriptional LysR family regulator